MSSSIYNKVTDNSTAIILLIGGMLYVWLVSTGKLDNITSILANPIPATNDKSTTDNTAKSTDKKSTVKPATKKAGVNLDNKIVELGKDYGNKMINSVIDTISGVLGF